MDKSLNISGRYGNIEPYFIIRLKVIGGRLFCFEEMVIWGGALPGFNPRADKFEPGKATPKARRASSLARQSVSLE